MNSIHPDIRLSIRVSAIVAALSLSLTVLIDPIWGFYDSYMATLASGQIGGIFFRESYHLGLSPMVKVLEVLHRQWPEMPWTGVMLLAMWVYIQSVATVVIIRSLHISESVRSILITSGFLLVFIWGFSFIEYSITGMGILMPMISLIAIWHVQRSTMATAAKWIMTPILSAGVIAGYALRIESGLGGTLIGALYILMTERSILMLLRVAVLPAVLVLLFFLRFDHELERHYYFHEVEPLVFYVTDSHNPPPLLARDSTEEIKNRLIRASFLIDSFQFNYDIYSKLAKEKWDYEKEHKLGSAEMLHQIADVAWPTISTNKLLTIVYLLTLCLGLSFTFRSQQMDCCVIAGFNIIFALIISFLAYSLKMEKWHYVPLMQTGILANVLYVAMHVPREKYLQSWLLLLIAVVLGLSLSISHVSNIYSNRKNIKEKRSIADRIFTRQKGGLVFLDVNTREIIDDFVFRPIHTRHDVYLYDMAQLPYLPEYERYLNDLCKCNAHSAKAFFTYIKSENRGISYYSTSRRVSMLSEFMRKVYGMEVVFRRVEATELRQNHYGLDTIVEYRPEVR